MTVDQVRAGKYDSRYTPAPPRNPDDIFFWAHVTITNSGTTTYIPDNWPYDMFYLNLYSVTDFGGTPPDPSAKPFLDVRTPPGGSTGGWIQFEIPARSATLVLRWKELEALPLLDVETINFTVQPSDL